MTSLGRIILTLTIILASTLIANAEELKFSTIIHSLAFDKNMKLVPLNEKNIPLLQNDIIQNLRDRLDATGRESFDASSKRLFDKAGDDPGRQNWVRFILIASLNNNNKIADQSPIAIRNMRLAGLLSSKTKAPITAPEVLMGRFPEWLGPLDPALKFPFDRDFLGRLRPGYRYSADCAKNGVPIPPALKLNADNDPSSNAANGWQIATRDAAQLTAAGLTPAQAQLQIQSYLEPTQQPNLTNKTSKMYYWIPAKGAKNQGICIANPIMDDPAANEPRVTALGIICQSVAEKSKFPLKRRYASHACFWDNNGPLDSTTSHNFTDGSFLAPPEPLNAPPDTAVNLPDDNRCTECHAGDNAFVIMPHDANEIAFRSFDSLRPTNNFHDHSNWFVPLIQSNWPQNVYRSFSAGLSTNPNDANNCGGCHKFSNAGRLPNPKGINPRDDLTKFCWFLLPNFMTQSNSTSFSTPGAMAGKWDANPGGDHSGVPALFSACQALFPGNTYPVPVPNSPYPVDFNAWLQPNVLP
jgi:hypothetical protein